MGIRAFLLFIPLLLFSNTTFTQSSGQPPKREMRGVWVATVKNLDYPQEPTTWPTAHKEEWKNLIKEYKSLGFNAIFFQVRPAGDAFYLSEHAPWSAYLTGRQDLPPKPEYDVLEFLVGEAHKNGMEFHAWLNPFRATMNLDTAGLSLRHVFNRHRNWMVKHGRRYYINPGVPEAREHICDVVGELVTNYDVDGVHFDDYFYPYPIANESFQDSAAYMVYGSRMFEDIQNWRRSNIDAMIELVSTTIKDIKPHVYFGISPFGVWRNKAEDSMGSETNTSIASYDDLYADALNWLRKDWIDYVAPQLYWHIGFEPADHQLLQRWWSLHTGNEQLYIGHAAYKLANDRQEQWYQPDQIARQIHLTRRNRRVDGSLFFRSSSILSDVLNIKDTLRTYYRTPAVLPEREGMSLAVHQAPDFKKVKSKRGDALVCWRPNKVNREHPPYYYIVYRFPGNGVGDTEDARNILKITEFGSDEKRFEVLDKRVEEGQVYTYMITAVNRAHIESRQSEAFTITRNDGRIRKYKRSRRK